MPGYQVETTTVRIAAQDYRIRSLLDRRQYSDPDRHAERAGVPPASWPMFGVLWPAGLALAEAMSAFAVGSRRILEVGCGLGLASLVLHRRRADITASDHHPLAEEFLRHNTDLNELPRMAFRNAPWSGPNGDLGCFDLIIGSDLLYERQHPALLADFLARHAKAAAQIILADPGRQGLREFVTRMLAQGYKMTKPWRRILSFVR